MESIFCRGIANESGNDVDTTAAVCRQLAGAFYGQSGIPAPWLAGLAMREEITALADKLAQIDMV